jgi:hypothetical protein
VARGLAPGHGPMGPNKINFRGVGLIARVDALEYVDGETEVGG